MDYRLLGRSGLRVSTLSLGTATFGSTESGGWGAVDFAEARQQIDMCLDAGVNVIDTSNAYAEGRSEEVVGQALKGRRDSVVLSTKVRFPVGDGVNDAGLSRFHILRAVEDSLRRLRTDHIDIYHVHEWDGQVPLDETLHALDSLVREGKVRYLGVSNYAGWQLMKALAVSDLHGYQRFVSNQIYYSLESRDAEYELLPLSVDQGLGVMVWSPLAGGLLTGKYRRDSSPEEGRHLAGWTEPPVRDEKRLYDTIDVIVRIAEVRQIPPAQVALAYLLTRPAVSTLIVGARTTEQLRQTLEAADVELSQAELDDLDEVSSQPLIYPHWHQAEIPAGFRGPSDAVLHGFR
ncbi:aldo/keto reductase [Antrihabitans cavernicola]|uniref:Aldo/keto reductase n=1 Tax=Antrihabitans cavernicola TaxID=2495913 RepID=A0A5A7S8T6_9NOCA|nr:aldo/keto reductase [Spelaeibacter cavernicola]KAA0022550.1 aldo/keto reductase [Spelaeibacter cavernicola]